MDLGALRDRALDLLVQGDTAGGISDLRAYLEARPDDAAAWLSIGAAYATIEHLPQAEAALRRALELDPASDDVRRALAQVVAARGVNAYDQRRHPEAAQLLEEAVRLGPERARSHYALGMAREALRDAGGAVAAYRAALRIDPGFSAARRTLADVFASLGEHAAAIAELDALLAADPGDEQAAHNRRVLIRALAEMERRRLLGNPLAELSRSVLVERGELRDQGDGRWAAPLLDLRATADAAGAIDSLLLVLRDPERAARAEGDGFQVVVVDAEGRRAPANLATAATLTFLREALGCPLTQAAALYARLLGGEASVAWGGARVAFDTVGDRHGLRVTLPGG